MVVTFAQKISLHYVPCVNPASSASSAREAIALCQKQASDGQAFAYEPQDLPWASAVCRATSLLGKADDRSQWQLYVSPR